MIHTMPMHNETFAARPHCELPDQALADNILCELKRVAVEYSASAAEACTTELRRLFERLSGDTLRAHEQLAEAMRQSRLHEAAYPAPPHEVQREAQRSQETIRSVRQFMRDRSNGGAAGGAQIMGGGAGEAQHLGRNAFAPAYSAQPMLFEPGPAANGGNGFAGAASFGSAPRLPEFALPHASPFGGLQQSHYAPVQTSFANINAANAARADQSNPYNEPMSSYPPADNYAIAEEAPSVTAAEKAQGAESGGAEVSKTVTPAEFTYETDETDTSAPVRKRGRRSKAASTASARRDAD
ncbi:spore coat protein [Paenibacillus alkalitolerans]|uniref:spore coat protein n=1 Tax=Paenibacillus alkalitolerans TaxID=2799335 RepID=UPI002D809E32|nr:spore coat protein [Paenibacillus alkalitolerans]